MSTSYNYFISIDFQNATSVNLNQLQTEIDSDVIISINTSHINQEGNDKIIIVFASSLDNTQKTALDSLITAYTYTSPSDKGISPLYEAVISLSTVNPGDYTSIVAALNDGKKSIYVRNGTYFEPSDIILTEGCQLIGESFGNVTIYGKSVIVDASGGVYESLGTISISNMSKNVIGTGTFFTNLQPGQYINIANNYMKIASITDNTNLVLVETYTGKSLSNNIYIAQNMYTAIALNNFIVAGAPTYGVFVRAVRHSSVQRISSAYSGTSNFYFAEMGDCFINVLVAGYCLGKGITIINCIDLLLDVCNIFNNVSTGLEVAGNCNFLALSRCTSTCNGSYGIHIKDISSEINILNSYTKLNNNHGIFSETTTKLILISSSISNDNNGDGVRVTGEKCTINGCIMRNNSTNGIYTLLDSVITCNECNSNTQDGIHSEGNNVTISSNTLTDHSEIGICVNGTNTTITSNRSKGNKKGIFLNIGANNNSVVSNQCINNVDHNILDSGIGNSIANNMEV